MGPEDLIRDCLDEMRESERTTGAGEVSEGLAAEQPPAAGLIDVVLASGMWQSRPRAMTAGDWLSELNPSDEIAALPEPVRNDLIGGSAA